MKTTASPTLLLLSFLSIGAVACSDGGKDSGAIDDTTGDDGGDGTDGTDGTDGGDEGADGGDEGADGGDEGADGGDEGDDGGDEGGGGDGGQVRIAHFGVFPDDANTEVDIWADGANTGVTLGFKQVTSYIPLPAGEYDLAVVPSGAELSAAVWTADDFPIADGDSWSVFAAGNVSGDPSAFNVFAFPENREGIPAGNVRVNVIHAASLSVLDPVDVWVADGDCAPVGDEPLLDEFAFGAVASDVDLPSTEIGVAFDVGGDGTVDACFQIPDTVKDEIVNVYAVNDDAGNITLQAQLPDNTLAEIMPVSM